MGVVSLCDSFVLCCADEEVEDVRIPPRLRPKSKREAEYLLQHVSGSCFYLASCPQVKLRYRTSIMFGYCSLGCYAGFQLYL